MYMPDWFPVVTLLIGYGTKSLTDWVQHRRTTERERVARQAVRQDQLFERRVTFQRETLLALQEAAAELGRATGRISHLDTMAVHSTGKTQLLPDDLNQGYHLAQVRMNLLGVRVRDDSVRDLVEKFRQFSVQSTMADTQKDRDRAMNAAMQTHIQLNERIGELLRTLDDTESPT
jgi:hypothetical protein